MASDRSAPIGELVGQLERDASDLADGNVWHAQNCGHSFVGRALADRILAMTRYVRMGMDDGK